MMMMMIIIILDTCIPVFTKINCLYYSTCLNRSENMLNGAKAAVRVWYIVWTWHVQSTPVIYTDINSESLIQMQQIIHFHVSQTTLWHFQKGFVSENQSYGCVHTPLFANLSGCYYWIHVGEHVLTSRRKMTLGSVCFELVRQEIIVCWHFRIALSRCYPCFLLLWQLASIIHDC